NHLGRGSMQSQIWMIVPGNAALSALILFVIAMPFLYAARRPVHDFVRALGHLAHGPLRLMSRSLFEAAQSMRYRNREVLLAHGREETETHMHKFEGIVNKTPEAEHALTVSAATQLAITALVLAIAAGGALINYKLIALPMSEMVGAGDYLTASLRTSDVAALVIIFVEA